MPLRLIGDISDHAQDRVVVVGSGRTMDDHSRCRI